MPRPIGVYQEYSSTIAAMRSAGATLQSIGDYCDVSRERIRQILKQHYPDTKPVRMTASSACEVTKVPVGSIFALIKRGVISPPKTGKRFYSFSPKDIKKLLDYVHKPCKHCGRPKPSRNLIYCRECSVKRAKYSYQFLSAAGKKRWRKRTCAWAKRSRANKKHREKKGVVDE